MRSAFNPCKNGITKLDSETGYSAAPTWWPIAGIGLVWSRIQQDTSRSVRLRQVYPCGDNTMTGTLPKRFFRSAALAAGLCAVISGPTLAQEMVLKAGHAASTSNTGHKAFEFLAQELADLSLIHI